MELITLAAAGAIGLLGYIQSRRFVRRKLRFVDAIEKTSVGKIDKKLLRQKYS